MSSLKRIARIMGVGEEINKDLSSPGLKLNPNWQIKLAEYVKSRCGNVEEFVARCKFLDMQGGKMIFVPCNQQAELFPQKPSVWNIDGELDEEAGYRRYGHLTFSDGDY